jgi:hypothetical protein
MENHRVFVESCGGWLTLGSTHDQALSRERREIARALFQETVVEVERRAVRADPEKSLI